MSFEFLSDDWFTEVDKLREAAGDLEIPAQMAEMEMNLRVTTDNGDVEMSLNKGNLERGTIEGASTTIVLPADMARKLFIDQDQSAAMQGFMSGQIKVEGDMSKMMSMQSVQPSAKQQALTEQIAAMTA